MGDSLMRGCAARMIASLDARFLVCGVVKPGSVTMYCGCDCGGDCPGSRGNCCGDCGLVPGDC
jgi:hypothetical protein